MTSVGSPPPPQSATNHPNHFLPVSFCICHSSQLFFVQQLLRPNHRVTIYTRGQSTPHHILGHIPSSFDDSQPQGVNELPTVQYIGTPMSWFMWTLRVLYDLCWLLTAAVTFPLWFLNARSYNNSNLYTLMTPLRGYIGCKKDIFTPGKIVSLGLLDSIRYGRDGFGVSTQHTTRHHVAWDELNGLLHQLALRSDESLMAIHDYTAATYHAYRPLDLVRCLGLLEIFQCLLIIISIFTLLFALQVGLYKNAGIDITSTTSTAMIVFAIFAGIYFLLRLIRRLAGGFLLYQDCAWINFQSMARCLVGDAGLECIGLHGDPPLADITGDQPMIHVRGGNTYLPSNVRHLILLTTSALSRGFVVTFGNHSLDGHVGSVPPSTPLFNDIHVVHINLSRSLVNHQVQVQVGSVTGLSDVGDAAMLHVRAESDTEKDNVLRLDGTNGNTVNLEKQSLFPSKSRQD